MKNEKLDSSLKLLHTLRDYGFCLFVLLKTSRNSNTKNNAIPAAAHCGIIIPVIFLKSQRSKIAIHAAIVGIINIARILFLIFPLYDIISRLNAFITDANFRASDQGLNFFS